MAGNCKGTRVESGALWPTAPRYTERPSSGHVGTFRNDDHTPTNGAPATVGAPSVHTT